MDNDIKILNIKEIKSNLKEFPGWKYANNKITKDFTYKSFTDAINFINKLTLFCNKIDHHPDIHIYYKKVVFDLQRFSVGGKVTERDFKVAKEIERLYKDYTDK